MFKVKSKLFKEDSGKSRSNNRGITPAYYIKVWERARQKEYKKPGRKRKTLRGSLKYQEHDWRLAKNLDSRLRM